MSQTELPELEQAVVGTTVHQVPTSDLRPADSPRREGECAEHVDTLLASGDDLPPLIVHRATMQVIDGMHRLEVAQRRGRSHVPVRFFDGDDRDCFPLAVRLNAVHGLPLSTADRIAAAERLAGSHPEWSDRRIAELVGVSPKTVAAHRSPEEVPRVNGRIGRDGRVHDPDTTSRRLAAAEYLRDNPDASLRAIARESGLSVGTARDVRLRVLAGREPVPDAGTGRSRPAPVRAPPVPAAPAPSSSLDGVFDCLRRDPTVRMSEYGRTLVRVIGASRALGEQPALLVTAVPLHQIESVAVAARQFSEVWSRFAEQLERGT